MSTNELEIRSEKLKEIRQLGIDPYPHTFKPNATAQELQGKFDNQPVGTSEEAAEGKTPTARIAGRLVLFRAMGKNAFGQIQDSSGRIQVMFNREASVVEGLDSQEPHMKFIEKKFDLGDIIGVEGHLFRTHKGELTLFVNKVALLCKTLCSLPDKYAGLNDKETRYRKRWLDLISNEDVRLTFLIRSKIIKSVRNYLDSHGFMEVETPVLQGIYGGADAKPFLTKLNALDQEMFMRISLEPPLKKLIVGGFDKVFEIGKVFRNEGLSKRHNPEFTMLEFYAAYHDYNDMMHYVENLFEKIALELYGTTKIKTLRPGTEEEIEVDVKAPWKRMSMVDAIATYGGHDVSILTDIDMKRLLIDSGHIDQKKLATMSRGLLIGALFEVFAEPHLIQPHHIIDHPIETTPFAKRHRDPELREQGFVERFESFILCTEIANAYSELNDPELQKELLELQADRRESGDEEACPYDTEFVEAIGQGMPPTGGAGIGLDRMVMFFTQAPSIRDVLFFPWMK